MAKYYVRGLSNTSVGRAKEYTPQKLRRIRKTFPSLSFVKAKKRSKK